MIKYVFKEAPVAIKNGDKANPQKIGEALTKLSAAHAGRLEPEHVVDEARTPKSPLHPHFEWNDKLAAHAHRLDQARAIIRVVRIAGEGDEPPKPAFISIADQGTAYRTVQEVVNSRALQLVVLRQAERDLKAFENRYSMLSEICEQVRVVRNGIEAERNKIETRAA